MTQTVYESSSNGQLTTTLLETLETHGADLSSFVLYDYIDSGAIEDLVHPEKGSPTMIMFELDEWLVTIHRGDSVTIDVNEGSLPDLEY